MREITRNDERQSVNPGSLARDRGLQSDANFPHLFWRESIRGSPDEVILGYESYLVAQNPANDAALSLDGYSAIHLGRIG